MSLINKMLQDLEARRSEGEVATTIHGQLRAAPEQKKMHVAWWIAAGLALILTGMISWLWGRQTAPTVIVAQPAMQPQLALKLAPGLSSIQPSSSPQPPPASKSPAIDGKSETLPVIPAQSVATPKEDTAKAVPNIPIGEAVRENAASKISDSGPAVAAAATATPAVSITPAATSIPSSSPSPTIARSASETSARVPAPEKSKARPASVPAPIEKNQTVSDFEVPATVSKQMKDLTPSQRAENEYRKATLSMQQGKTTEAIGTLEQALQIDPQHSVARQTLVGLLLENKRQDEAVRKLQEGLNLERSQPALAMMLARLQIERNDLRPAIETLQRTLPYAADRADYLAFLAALLQRDTRHKEAIEHYLLALRKAPQNGLWWMGLAISLQAENRVQESRDAFGRAKASSTLSPELAAFVDQKLNQLR